MYENKNIDQGYAWVIFVASFFTYLLQGGILFSVGVFYEMFLNLKPGSDKASIALICSLTMGLFYFVGMLTSVLCNMFGIRKVSIGGSIVGACGLTLSSFCTEVYQLCLTYGIMTGKYYNYNCTVYLVQKSTFCIQCCYKDKKLKF